MGPKTEMPASALRVVVACVAGLQICYMAATRTRKVPVTGVAVASADLTNSRLRSTRSTLALDRVSSNFQPAFGEKVGRCQPLSAPAVDRGSRLAL